MGKKGRVFLRGMTSEQYGLKEFREEQLAAPRVRNDEVVVDDAKVGHSGDSADSRTWWRIGPGDEQFLTQNLQVHFVEIPAGKANHGHGHQNEAVFYILEGSGYEIHDDKRYPWEAGDVAVVHTDSVHRHFNDGDVTAKALVFKAKSTWMYFNLIQQGRSGPIENDEKFGPREEWGRDLDRRRRGAHEGRQVDRRRLGDNPRRPDPRDHVEGHAERPRLLGRPLRAGDPAGLALGQALAHGRRGRVRDLRRGRVPAVGGRGRDRRALLRTHRHGADGVAFKADDTLYVPQNHVHQYVNTGAEPLRILVAQNRLIKFLGYDRVETLEDAPEFEGSKAAAAGAGA